MNAYLREPPENDISSLIRTSEGLRMRSLDSVVFNGAEVIGGRSRETNNVASDNGIDMLSPLSGSMRGFDFEDLDNQVPSGRRSAPPKSPSTAASFSMAAESLAPADLPPRPSSTLPVVPPPHAIATPRPTLMFAIASDDAEEVERVLAAGEARPDDSVGPQSALEFALTSENLSHKTEIVKTLLAYGADAGSLPDNIRREVVGGCDSAGGEASESTDVVVDLASSQQETVPSEGGGAPGHKRRASLLNPATKYYLKRAAATAGAQAPPALRRTIFRPLARMRFDFVGQDRALEQLYWVLGMHAAQQQPRGGPIAPLVVLCCGRPPQTSYYNALF